MSVSDMEGLNEVFVVLHMIENLLKVFGVGIWEVLGGV